MLTGLSTGQIQEIAVTPGKAHESNSVVCLKVPERVLPGLQGSMWNTSGGPYMATAGSGDVLTGVIAALAARASTI